MENDFYSFEEFPIPSIWTAADGSNYGYIAECKLSNWDIVVQQTLEGIPTGVRNTIDYFKMQYRYKESMK